MKTSDEKKLPGIGDEVIARCLEEPGNRRGKIVEILPEGKMWLQGTQSGKRYLCAGPKDTIIVHR